LRREAQLWLEDAEYDLQCAQDMLEKKRYNYAVWLARQSVEKALKAAFLIKIKEPIPFEHNLLTLAESLHLVLPEAVRSDLVFLNPHYTVARYVDAAVGKPADLFSLEFAAEALEKAKRVHLWLKKILKI